MKGFTFIELLLGVLIIGGLMLFFLPRYTQQVQKEHQTQMNALNSARNLQKQLDAQQARQQQQLDQLGGARPLNRKR